MHTIQQTVQKIVEKAVSEFSIQREHIHIEHPVLREHGEFATNAALILAKKNNENPMELAKKIVQKISAEKSEILERIEVRPPGFINVFLSKKCIVNELYTIQKEQGNYGKLDIGKGRTAIVEYSSPNIAKPFTIGHLRSTIIGDAVANLLAFSGYKVLRDNHLGDWGTQFGKQIVAIKKWGDESAIMQSKNPVHELVKLYVKFHSESEKDPALDDEARDWFVRLEQGDKEARRIWKLCVNLSMKQFKKIYKRLHVQFDMMLGESFFEHKLTEVIADFAKKGIAKKSQGALLIFYPKDLYPPLMIQKKDGATLYSTRDLATDKYRIETWGKDILILNEVGAEQRLYFQQLFEAEEMAGYCKKSQRVHIAHGLIRFKQEKMSTRKGNVIWLEDVLQEAVLQASVFNKKVAQEVGIGALKYNDLKRESSKHSIFDWKEVLNLQGNSGPYLQYTYARAVSVLAKYSGEHKIRSIKIQTPAFTGKLTELERILYQFPEVVEKAVKAYAPHHICTYLFQLAQGFNTFYAKEPILKAGKNTEYRVLLTQAVAQILQNGLTLLGIQPVTSM